MKRSDMVLIIKDILYDGYSVLRQNGKHLRIADKILQRIEDNGMLPPDTDKNPLGSAYWRFPLHEWESE